MEREFESASSLGGERDLVLMGWMNDLEGMFFVASSIDDDDGDALRPLF